MATLASVTVREGRKVIASNNAPIATIQSIMAESMPAQKIMAHFASLRAGNTFSFNHKGKRLTVAPLVSHIDQY